MTRTIELAVPRNPAERERQRQNSGESKFFAAVISALTNGRGFDLGSAEHRERLASEIVNVIFVRGLVPGWASSATGNIERMAVELCWEIENLPASEQQTALSLKASALHTDLSRLAGNTPLMSHKPARERPRFHPPDEECSGEYSYQCTDCGVRECDCLVDGHECPDGKKGVVVSAHAILARAVGMPATTPLVGLAQRAADMLNPPPRTPDLPRRARHYACEAVDPAFSQLDVEPLPSVAPAKTGGGR